MVPSVLLLLLSGVIIRYISIYFNLPLYTFDTLLPLLGTVGLILIVFEGALELRYDAGKKKLIRNAFFAALFILLLTSFSIAFFLQYFTQQPLYICLLNAIPYSVISSAIAIPSVASLQDMKKEFIVYESSFSDILGIMVFNLILVNESFTGNLIVEFSRDVLLLGLLSLLCCFGFFYLMGRMKHHVKFFLIISALVLVYAVGKQLHVSTLIIVLAFGLFMCNIQLILQKMSQLPWLERLKTILSYPSIGDDVKSLHQLSAESAFLLRTFFFLVFGYTLALDELFQVNTVLLGLGIMFIVYLLRWIYLRVIAKAHLWPELVISPRGLISVLLFLSIPADKLISPNGKGLLIFVILLSGLLMTIGLITTGRRPTESGDE